MEMRIKLDNHLHVSWKSKADSTQLRPIFIIVVQFPFSSEVTQLRKYPINYAILYTFMNESRLPSFWLSNKQNKKLKKGDLKHKEI